MSTTRNWAAPITIMVLLGTLVTGGCGGCDQRCRPADCQGYQYCDGHQCQSPKIVILEPTNEGFADSGVVIRAQIKAEDAIGALNLPPELEYSVSEELAQTGGINGDMVLIDDAGLIYKGNVSLGAGRYRLHVESPDVTLVSSYLTFTVDTTGPILTLDAGTKTGLRTGGPSTPDDRDPSLIDAFKRDDVVMVSVSAASAGADTDPSSFALSVQGVNSGELKAFDAGSPVDCGSQSLCWTVPVDLGAVEMSALRGLMRLVVTTRDTVGNQSSAEVSFPVTRFKWSRLLPNSPVQVLASPAVGSNGTIYVGTNSGGVSTLSAIKPDGTDQWPSPVTLGGPFLASPAVGKGDGREEVVYAFPSKNPPVLYALLGSDGGQATSPISLSPIVGTLVASPMVALTDQNVLLVRETAITYLNSTAGPYSLVSLRFGAPSAATAQGNGGSIRNPGNIVGKNNRAFVSDSAGNLVQYDYYDTSGSWFPGSVLTDAGTADGQANGLSFSGEYLAGSTAGSVFAWSTTTQPYFRVQARNPSIPSFLGKDLVYSDSLNSQSNAVRITPVPNASPVVGALGVTTTTPLVSAFGDGGIYFVGTDSSIRELDFSLATRWAGTVETTGVVASSPNIDCARNADGSKRPGHPVLYYGADNGKLYAVIVDHPLDVNSPWPKYQHDPRNTGSIDTSLSEFVCP